MKIPQFGVPFVQLCLSLAISAYTRVYALDVDLLFEGPASKLFQPFFFVSKHGGDLFVTIRGSHDQCDFDSLQHMGEIETKYGRMLEVFYRAALYIYLETYDTIKNFDGRVYLTGHSLGAGVAAALLSVLKTEFPTREFYAIVFAPPPAIGKDTSNKYKDIIATFVNGVDVIPTLSPKNLAYTVAQTVPEFATLPLELSLTLCRDLFDSYNVTGVPDGPQVREALKDCVACYLKAAIDYILRGSYTINYPPGTVFHLGEKHDSLEDCIVDPEVEFKGLSADTLGIFAHTPMPYYEAINLIGSV